MSIKFWFFTILCLFLLTSCSDSSNSEISSTADEVVIDDGYKTTAAGEIIIDDSDFDNKKEAGSVARESSRATTRTIADGSQIETIYDSYGNKTEKRTFNNDTLRFILIKTSAEGNRQIFVYGQNGDVKSLPENMTDKVLTASSNEVASSAAIYKALSEPTYTQNTQSPTVNSLQPLPSSQLPINNQAVEQLPQYGAEKPVDEAGKPQSVENKRDNEAAAKSETPSRQKSDEE